MDHVRCLTCRFVSAKGWGYAILHRNREAFVHLKKVAKMSENDHKSPSCVSFRSAVGCIEKDFFEVHVHERLNSHTKQEMLYVICQIYFGPEKHFERWKCSTLRYPFLKSILMRFHKRYKNSNYIRRLLLVYKNV